MIETQKFPDSDQELGPKQRAYVERVFGSAYFRNPKTGPLVKPLGERKHEDKK